MIKHDNYALNVFKFYSHDECNVLSTNVSMTISSKLILGKSKKKMFSVLNLQAYNHHLESFNTADKNQGAVFRALPVYRVRES